MGYLFREDGEIVSAGVAKWSESQVVVEGCVKHVIFLRRQPRNAQRDIVFPISAHNSSLQIPHSALINCKKKKVPGLIRVLAISTAGLPGGGHTAGLY